MPYKPIFDLHYHLSKHHFSYSSDTTQTLIHQTLFLVSGVHFTTKLYYVSVAHPRQSHFSDLQTTHISFILQSYLVNTNTRRLKT